MLSVADWLILALVAVLLALAVWRIIAAKRKGRGCSGACAGCAEAGRCTQMGQNGPVKK